jgi:hypothetical protein
VEAYSFVPFEPIPVFLQVSLESDLEDAFSSPFEIIVRALPRRVGNLLVLLKAVLHKMEVAFA